MTGKLFILSASSGAGKTSLARELIKKKHHKQPLELIVGYTSRPPRDGEVDGVDYHFVSLRTFKNKIAAGEFLEWNAGYGHYYGTPKDVLDKLNQGVSCVAVVGVRSIETILTTVPQAITIWVMVSDIKMLEQRLKKRGHGNELIEERIKVARKEAEWIKTVSHFHYKIINDCFEDAIAQLQKIVLTT